VISIRRSDRHERRHQHRRRRNSAAGESDRRRPERRREDRRGQLADGEGHERPELVVGADPGEQALGDVGVVDGFPDDGEELSDHSGQERRRSQPECVRAGAEQDERKGASAIEDRAGIIGRRINVSFTSTTLASSAPTPRALSTRPQPSAPIVSFAITGPRICQNPCWWR
jgi:hypothetical protein